MHKIVDKIGGLNVYEYWYLYTDYETKKEKTGSGHYIRFSEVPEEYKEEFNKWMYGQTMPIIPGEEGGVDGVYPWDWERWYEMKTRGTPTYFD